MIPRIQGKVGQATEPKEMSGKWFFEMWISELGQGERQESLGQFGPWDSEAKALSELKSACRLACEAIEKRVDGKVSGQYIDMNTNQTRRWEEN